MTQDDPPRHLPAPLARYREQILAHAEAEEEPQPSRPRHRRLVPLSAAAVAAAFVAVIVLLDTGRVAHALSIVNRAPAAAAASESVTFTSAITITRGPRTLEDYTEHGAIDFTHRDFSTALSLGHEGGTIEQRRVGSDLYYSQTKPHAPARWLAIRLAHEPIGRFSSSAESEQFTAPPALLDALASTRSPVSSLGHKPVEGVPTNVYELHTDLAAFLHASTGGRPQPPAYANVAATITVWLDGKGRPRQVKEAFTSGTAKLTTIVTFRDYSQPVHISAPPDSAVVARKPISSPSPIAASPSDVFLQLLFLRSPDQRPVG
jgi:hypothetical protein